MTATERSRPDPAPSAVWRRVTPPGSRAQTGAHPRHLTRKWERARPELIVLHCGWPPGMARPRSRATHHAESRPPATGVDAGRGHRDGGGCGRADAERPQPLEAAQGARVGDGPAVERAGGLLEGIWHREPGVQGYDLEALRLLPARGGLGASGARGGGCVRPPRPVADPAGDGKFRGSGCRPQVWTALELPTLSPVHAAVCLTLMDRNPGSHTTPG